MAAKLKVDQIESVDGSSNITLNQSVTMASGKTLPAASLTGALPAISGANLTGVSGGKVLQAVTTSNNTHISQSNNTEYTQLTTSITPSATTSKILVMVTLGAVSHSTTLDSGYIIARDISGGATSNLEVGTGGTRNVTFHGTHNTGTTHGTSASCQLLDSPNTTSTIEYKVFGHINNGNFIINKRGADNTTNAASRMVLMEIGA